MTRIAYVMLAASLGVEALSLAVRIPLLLFAGMHIAIMVLGVGFLLRVRLHHRLYRQAGMPFFSWDPMAPLMPFPVRGTLLVLGGVINLGVALILETESLLTPDPELAVHPFDFAATWAFFAAVVAAFSPTVDRRIAAARRVLGEP